VIPVLAQLKIDEIIQEDRKAIDLILTIDRSGSMRREKM